MALAKRILVVEDDPHIRASLAELLEDEGYSVSLAENGQEGLDTLRSVDLFDLILLDLMMPIKDGFAFRREQRAHPFYAHVPVLVFSADTSMVHQGNEFHDAQILRKPVDLIVLLDTVEKLCG